MTISTFLIVFVLGVCGMLAAYLIGREHMFIKFKQLNEEWYESVLNFRKERAADIIKYHSELNRIVARHNFTTTQRPFKVINGNKNTSPTILDLTQNFTNQEYYH